MLSEKRPNGHTIHSTLEYQFFQWEQKTDTHTFWVGIYPRLELQCVCGLFLHISELLQGGSLNS